MGLLEKLRDRFLEIRKEEQAYVLLRALHHLEEVVKAGSEGCPYEIVHANDFAYLQQLGLVRTASDSVFVADRVELRYYATLKGIQVHELCEKIGKGES